jgi:hypothetical protein
MHSCTRAGEARRDQAGTTTSKPIICYEDDRSIIQSEGWGIIGKKHILYNAEKAIHGFIISILSHITDAVNTRTFP